MNGAQLGPAWMWQRCLFCESAGAGVWKKAGSNCLGRNAPRASALDAMERMVARARAVGSGAGRRFVAL